MFFGATVTIVGVDEAGIEEGKASVGSPVALALLGMRAGDERQVRTPRGPEAIEVTAIRYPKRPSSLGSHVV